MEPYQRGITTYCNQKPRHLYQIIVQSEASCFLRKVACLRPHGQSTGLSNLDCQEQCFRYLNCIHVFAHPEVFCLEFTPRSLKKFTFFVLTV